MVSSAPIAGEPGSAAQQEKDGHMTILGGEVSPGHYPVGAPSPLVSVPDPDDSALQWDCGVIMHGLDFGMNGKLERRHSGVRNIPLIQCSGTAHCFLSRHCDASHDSTPGGALIRDFFSWQGSQLILAVCSGRQWSRNGSSVGGNQLMRANLRGKGTGSPVEKRAKCNEEGLNQLSRTPPSLAHAKNQGL